MNMEPCFRKSQLAIAVTLLSLTSISQALELEEVIITAQKRAESLQDVPISVSAIQGDKIDDAGIPNLAALADYVPNLHIAEAPLYTNIYMRGVGSGENMGFEQSVGMYIDGVYMGRGRQYRSAFLDVERVEVLRGPQGTLFGRNTVAGAINVVTASASPDEELNGQIAVSAEENGGKVVEGYISSGITDTFGARLAFKYRDTDGYADNTFLNDTEGKIEESTYRLSFSWAPTDALALDFKYSNSDYERVGSPTATMYLGPQERNELFPNRSAFADIAYTITDLGYPEIAQESLQEFTTYKDNNFGRSQADGIGLGFAPDGSENDIDNMVLTANWDIDAGTLSSVTGYSAYDYEDGADVDWLPIQFLFRGEEQDLDQISQEFRFTSPGGEFFDYVAGVYWDKSTLEFDRRVDADFTMDGLVPEYLGVNGLLTLLTGGAYNAEQTSRSHNYELDSESWAVFGQGTFNFTENFRLTLGLRYTEEEKDVISKLFLSDSDLGIGTPNNSYFLAATYATAFNTYAYNYDEDRTTDAWIPSMNLQLDISNDSMLYFSASKGFKSGGFTASDEGEPGGLTPGSFPCAPNNDFTVDISSCYDSTIPGEDFEFDDEEVVAFEIGGKHRLLDGGMTINWALFNTEYSDLQTAIFDGLGAKVKNAASSEILGIEVDTMWQATDQLRLGANFAWLDASYDSFEDAPCTAIQLDADSLCGTPLGSISNDLSGKPTLYASEYSASLIFDYVRVFNSGLELFTSGEVNYRDDYNSSGDNDPIDVVDSSIKVNLRLGLRGDSWEFMAYGRNLTDEESFMQSFDTPVVAGSHSQTISEGRVLGARLKYTF